MRFATPLSIHRFQGTQVKHVTPETIEGYRLSPEQALLCERMRDGARSCACIAIRLTGPLRRSYFWQAVRTLVERHEILRTKFVTPPGMSEPLQVIEDAGTFEPVEFRRPEWAGRPVQTIADEVLAADGERLRDDAVLPIRVSLIELAAEDHVAVLTLRSLCADTASLDAIMLQLAVLHGEGDSDGSRDFETLQYADVSEWRRQLLEGGDEPSRAHWEKTQTANASLFLPFEKTGQQDLSPAFESVSIEIPSPADPFDVPLPAMLLTCWHLLLARLSGQDDIVLACKTTGRSLEASTVALGIFEQYLPVVMRAARQATVPEVARANCDEMASAAQHGHFFSWRAAAGVSHPPQPLPRAAFAWEEWPDRMQGDGVTFELASRLECPQPFGLRLTAFRRAGVLNVTLVFDATRYARPSMTDLAERYRRLLDVIVSGEAIPWHSLEVLLPSERERLAQWNTTKRQYSAKRLVHERFSDWAKRSPDTPAVVAAGRSISFSELEQRSNRLARHLISLGIGAEQAVALWTRRSIDMVTGYLAILKAGAAVVPADEHTPLDRIASLVSTNCVTCLLSEGKLAQRASAFSVPVIAIDRAADRLTAIKADAPRVPLQPANAAYIISTSGSTGKPKPVVVQHGSLLNLAWALKQQVYTQCRGGCLRVAVNASIAFDASIKQIVQLAFGHTLVLIPEHVRRDPRQLLEFAAAQKIDVLDCTPAMLRELHAVRSGGAGYWPSLMLVGGEAIDPATWSECASMSTASVNVYGPTECTVDATACRIDVGLPNIGRPLANVSTYVVDPDLRQVPIGAAGELCIGGQGVARGYRRVPGSTAERFVPDPFSSEPGARMYRSGDIARHRSDGAIEFLGRADRQIKLRGYRIELDEIEAVLSACPGVKQAACILRTDKPGQEQLVAYVAPYRYTADGRERADARPGHYMFPDGLWIKHLNQNETKYLYREIFENESYVRHGLVLPEQACVFDVGANIGMFALFVQRRSAGARVYAFEPLAPLFDVLGHNAGSHPGTRIFPYGLGGEDCERTFTYYPRYSMMSGLSEYADQSGDVRTIKKSLQNARALGDAAAAELLRHADGLLEGRFDHELHNCRLRRMSDVIREERVTRIDLLKIDVQRSELDVLAGIEDEHWGLIGQVVMEVHDEVG